MGARLRTSSTCQGGKRCCGSTCPQKDGEKDAIENMIHNTYLLLNLIGSSPKSIGVGSGSEAC